MFWEEGWSTEREYILKNILINIVDSMDPFSLILKLCNLPAKPEHVQKINIGQLLPLQFQGSVLGYAWIC